MSTSTHVKPTLPCPGLCLLDIFKDKVSIPFKGAWSRYFEITSKLNKPEDKHLRKQRNTKEITTNHNGTTMAKDGEDQNGLQTNDFKNLG